MLIAKLSSVQITIIFGKIFWMPNEESSCGVRTEDNQQEENSTHYPLRHFLLQTPFPSPMKDAIPDGNVGATRLDCSLSTESQSNRQLELQQCYAEEGR